MIHALNSLRKEEEQLLYITYVCVCISAAFVSEERNIGPKIKAHIHNLLLFV